jgi:hypothetical protein
MRRLAVIALFSLVSGVAQAAPLPGCLPPIEVRQVLVTRVEQNGVLVLTDGNAVKVEGLLLPAGSKDHAPDVFRTQALQELDDLSTGRHVQLRVQDQKEDRYGRLRAQVIFLQADDERWLQVAMLRRGLARVSIAPDRRECAAELYAAETEARDKARGLWASPAYAVREPTSLHKGDLGTFQIVEGQVVNAAVRGGRAYLNFGRNWKTDFTATIAPDDMKAFRADGIDPASYAGKWVRVRGFVDRMNGFEIGIAVPEDIESVKPGSQLRSSSE